MNSPTSRSVALGIAIAVSLLPSLDLAVSISVLFVVLAWASASHSLYSRKGDVPRSLITAHIGIGLMGFGTLVRMIEAAAAGGELVLPSWADLLVVPGFALTILALFQAARARAATAQLGDLLDAIATAAVPVGAALILGWPYLSGSAPLAERAVNGWFLFVDAIFLTLMLLLIYGPGTRSRGAIWIGSAGLVAVGFDLTVFLGLATEATWKDEPLRLLAIAFILYAIATSHETYVTFASPGTRPQRYRWQIYAAACAVLLVVTALTNSSQWLLVLGVVLAAMGGRLILTGITAGRLTAIVDTQSQLARSLSGADTVEEAFDAGEAACRQLMPNRKVSVVSVQDLVPGMSGSTMSSIIVAEGESVAVVVGESSSLPPHLRVAFEQIANVVDFALGSIESRAQRAELDALAAIEDAKIAAEKAWQELSVDSHDVAVRIISGLVAQATPNSKDRFGFDPVGVELTSLPVLNPHRVGGEAFEDPTQPGCWVKVFERVEADNSIIYTIRDVTPEVVDARTDPVTGLRNQADFDSSLAITSQTVLVFFFHDVDRLSDSSGKAAADKLIRALSERVSGAFRSSDDRIWRGEGPRLIVTSAQEDGQEWIEPRRQSLCAPLTIDGQTLSPTVTVGAVAIDDEILNGVSARVRAETALNHARERMRNTTMWYSEELFAEVSRRWQIETSLELALADPGAGGFDVHYQPIVATTDGEPVSAAEALARWTHPELGEVPPGEFIPIAEAKSLVGAIDSFVLNRAIDDLARFRSLDPEFKLHVNMSPMVALAEKLREVAETVSLRIPDCAAGIVVEITETGLGSQELTPVVESCHVLRALGIGLAIDDFGTGESNFDRVGSLPLTEVKLARSFALSDDAVMVSSFIRTAHHMGLKCIAENVETEGQRDLVAGAGADYIQGYLYAKPAKLDQVLEWIQSRSQQSASAPT